MSHLKVLYILQIYQDGNQNTAHVSSVSEFTLAQPCLSFAILDARTKKFKITKGDDSHLDEITTGNVVAKFDQYCAASSDIKCFGVFVN